MALFIDKEIDFKSEILDFLKTSYIGQELYNYLYSDIINQELTDESKNKKLYFLTPILKGFLENIIKHDLPIQAVSKIDTKWLIGENNSNDVQVIFNKIYFPEEKDLEQNSKFIDEAKEMCSEIIFNINKWIFEQEYDPVSFFKKEFVDSHKSKKDKKNGI